MFMSRDEKERRIIDLYYNQGKTTREIIKELRVSPNYVSAILKKEEEKNNNIVTNKQQQPSSSSHATKAYELLSEGKIPLQVAIALNIKQSEVIKYYKEYWILKRLHKLYSAYTELGDEGLGAFLKLYRLMKEKEVSNEQVANYVDIAIHKLPYMESLYAQTKDQAEKMQRTRQGLANDIEERKKKISLLDNIIFSSEQECKRTEQQLQELGDKKDRLEKLLANLFLANHRYTRAEATLQ